MITCNHHKCYNSYVLFFNLNINILPVMASLSSLSPHSAFGLSILPSQVCFLMTQVSSLIWCFREFYSPSFFCSLPFLHRENDSGPCRKEVRCCGQSSFCRKRSPDELVVYLMKCWVEEVKAKREAVADSFVK